MRSKRCAVQNQGITLIPYCASINNIGAPEENAWIAGWEYACLLVYLHQWQMRKASMDLLLNILCSLLQTETALRLYNATEKKTTRVGNSPHQKREETWSRMCPVIGHFLPYTQKSQGKFFPSRF